MEFCDKCGSLFKRKDDKFICQCGQIRDNFHLNTKENIEKLKPIEIVKEDIEVHAVTPVSCPKCQYAKAYTWSKQMRGSDEPETIFFKCVKCSHSWRKSRG